MAVGESRWHNRNYPKRGEERDVLIKDMELPSDTLVYIGKKNGSGFDWIGLFGAVPEEFLEKRVLEQYRRTYGYEGEILLVEDGYSQKKKGGSGGKYWNWDECEKTVPPFKSNDQLNPEAAERLLMAIMRDSALDYKNDLNRALHKLQGHPEETLRDVVEKIRHIDRQKIGILVGTSRGEYILQRIEDEAVIKAMNVDWEKLSYPVRQKILDRESKRMRIRRVREKEAELYADIKGRSVKGDIIRDSGTD